MKLEYFENDEELIPYKSKKKKRKSKKSSHKHKYNKVICSYNLNNSPHYVLGEECAICKKIKKCNFILEFEKEGKKVKRLFPSLEEILKVYPNLPLVKISELG